MMNTFLHIIFPPLSLFFFSSQNIIIHTDALMRYCDLTSTVRKTVLPKLALYATSKDQQTKLMWLSSTEGREEYQNNIAIPGRTIIELMEKFSSLKIPFCDFLELVPRLMSRGRFLIDCVSLYFSLSTITYIYIFHVNLTYIYLFMNSFFL